ncbi:MFS general substrate transporter [Aulographum hederae CBS 113979]|uniref:MFS general substrate transporter n=1 Tax=Aulographum hederae CBS 113979 TaxID=1176131 RepID=A0A6G1H501_9PEZI|nr:MFS general substrate transporter [Aulographum hederae CBS 113979]
MRTPIAQRQLASARPAASEEYVALGRISQSSFESSRSAPEGEDDEDDEDNEDDEDENDGFPTLGLRASNDLEGGSCEAWKVLLGVWLVDFMTSGVWVAFGIFQSYYVDKSQFSSSTGIPTIGTLLGGTAWIATPLTNAVVIRYPERRIHMLWLGWVFCLAGLFLASFATEVWHLELFQGFTYGVGWVTYWSPMMVIMNEWWLEHRGLAYGIWFTASNASGFCMPFLVQKCLEKYGFRVTLRLYALLSVFIAGPGMLLIRSRPKHPFSAASPRKRAFFPLDKEVLRNKHLYIYAVSIFLQSLVYIIPSIFLPSIAEALNLSPSSGSILLAISSGATICGQITFGFLSDRLHPYINLSVSSLISSVAAFFILGQATGMAHLSLFAAIWGLFAGSYDVLFARVCSVLSTDPDAAITLYGFLSFERGVSVLLEGPISDALLGVDAEGFGRYHALIQLAAWCMLASSLGGLGWFYLGKG